MRKCLTAILFFTPCLGTCPDVPKCFAFVFADVAPFPVNTIGHELGHAAFGFADMTDPNDTEDLMNKYYKPNRNKMRKYQWDIMHP